MGLTDWLSSLQHWQQQATTRTLLKTEASHIADALIQKKPSFTLQLDGPCYTLPTPLTAPVFCALTTKQRTANHSLYCMPEQLPFANDSVDALLIPHILEGLHDFEPLLAEAARILAPQGILIITGINPYSLLGIQQYLPWQRHYKNQPPWCGQLRSAHHIAHKITLNALDIGIQRSFCFALPFSPPQHSTYQIAIENTCHLLWPSLGAAYIIVAKKQCPPLTPVKMSLFEQLNPLLITDSAQPVAEKTCCNKIKPSHSEQ